jgi:hypothetical protein
MVPGLLSATLTTSRVVAVNARNRRVAGIDSNDLPAFHRSLFPACCSTAWLWLQRPGATESCAFSGLALPRRGVTALEHGLLATTSIRSRNWLASSTKRKSGTPKMSAGSMSLRAALRPCQ